MFASPRSRFVVGAAVAALSSSPAVSPAVSPAQAPPQAPPPAPASEAPASSAIRGDTILVIRLRDGSVHYGRVIEETTNGIVLLTIAGARVEIGYAQIESHGRTSGRAVNGVLWVEDPSATRLFFTATARPLQRGSGYIANFELFLPHIAYGVTDRFSIAAGMPIDPWRFGRVWYVASTYTLSLRERSAIAVGALAFVEPSVDIVNGILYANGTWGSRDRAVTVGAGLGYRDVSGVSEVSNNPVLMFGFESRLSRRVKFVTENLVTTGPESECFFSGGLRFIFGRFSADLGLGKLHDKDTSGGCCIPVVNFAHNFGKR